MKIKKITAIQILITFLALSSCESNMPEINDTNYYDALRKLEQYEKGRPKLFLEADGRYSENFWGDKFDISVEISNDAKLATYKDVEIRVTYYSKTNSILGTNDYTLYEVIPPQKITKARMKIDNYRDVESIGWQVVGAAHQN